MKRSAATFLNILALYAVAGILLAAFAMQIARHELPCPLCLLQRALFAALAIGPILNLRYGPRPAHYAFSMIAALTGAAISIRQILLHILPGDPGYGSALFGYHYYTWAFLLFATALALLALMLLWDRQFREAAPARDPLVTIAAWLVIALTAANIVSTALICGFAACPDNPVRYELLR